MGNLLTFNFWFNSHFMPLLPLWRNILLGAVLFFVAAALVFGFLKLRAKTRKKLWSEIFDFSLVNVIIGLCLLLFYYEQARVLTARIWFVLWFVEILFWGWKLFKYGKTFYAKRDNLMSQDSFKKYLPK